MATDRGERARRPRPWWLGGWESCGFCFGIYAIEMETRCESCDRPHCPMCAVESSARHAARCRDCENGDEDHGG